MVKELLSEDVKHACQLKDYQAQISELQSARDKDSLRYAAFEEDKRKASSDAFDAARAWESEKRELLKSRDEALVHAKTTDNKVKELLSEDAKHACQLKDYQTQISELQSARDKDSLRHAAVEEEEKRELLKSRDEALTIVKELLSEGTKHAGQLKECQIQILELQSARDNDSLRLAVVEEAERKASSAASDAARIWEEEKRELLKSRDEALVHAKSTDNMVKKLVIENTKHAYQLKDYQAQISELQSARDKDSLRHAAFEEDKRKASSAASDAARTWEEEKRGLLKSRDEALVHAKSTDNMVKKLVIENTKHACQLKDYQAQISELRSARDKDSLRHAALFVAAVEKGKSEASSAASAAARSWEEDKLRLERARVEALARADTADKLVKKPLSDDVKDISKLNERRIKMLELQSARARDTAAAKNASPPSPTTEELSKRHAQELKTLHIQLTALCKASLKAAANAAILFTKEEAAVAATSGKSTQADTRTAISIKSHDAEPRARHVGTAMMSTRFAAARGLPPMGPTSSAAATVATKVEAAANVVSHGVPTSRVSPPGAVMVRGSTQGATPGRGDATPHAQGATPAVSIIDAASKQSREDVLVVEQVKRVKPAADLKATTASTRRVAFRPRSPDM
ncbi:hypothetical protein EDB19DRAFT_766999 [Suillus lakei]|nr:hypothetical protein EDB19DRAFT_766999 [Suillus lakei]